jgi:hypothetical protein
MSTLNKVFAKFSAQEPMKVELKADSLINLKGFLENGIKYSKNQVKDARSLTNILSEYLPKIATTLKSNDYFLGENQSYIKRAEASLREVELSAKELGIAPTAVPDYNTVSKLLDEFKMANKELEAARTNLNNLK